MINYLANGWKVEIFGSYIKLDQVLDLLYLSICTSTKTNH